MKGFKFVTARTLVDKIISQAKEVAFQQRLGHRDSWLEEKQKLEDLREELLSILREYHGEGEHA